MPYNPIKFSSALTPYLGPLLIFAIGLFIASATLIVEFSMKKRCLKKDTFVNEKMVPKRALKIKRNRIVNLKIIKEV
jgi:hypothetical protein